MNFKGSLRKRSRSGNCARRNGVTRGFESILDIFDIGVFESKENSDCIFDTEEIAEERKFVDVASRIYFLEMWLLRFEVFDGTE